MDTALFKDEEADKVVCSYKQTTFMASMIASVICNLFVNFCTNYAADAYLRDLPYLTEYSALTMYLKTIE